MAAPNDAGAGDPDPDTERTATESTADGEASAPRPGGATLLVQHRDGLAVVEIRRGQRLVIGRSRQADLVVRDEAVSRLHARFTVEAGGLWVEDLESKHGTRVGRSLVHRRHLAPGDVVHLGSVLVAPSLVEGSDPATQGLDSHERFLASVEQEVARSRRSHRPLALLMVAPQRGPGGETISVISGWSAAVRRAVRPLDRIALYGPGIVEAALVEQDAAQATALAHRIVSGDAGPTPSPLRCGVAAFPGAADTADALIENARAALRAATPEHPVQVAPGADGRAYHTTPAALSDEMIVRSPAMVAVSETIGRVARSDVPVLILGPSGTGKELVARAVHRSSPRRDRELVCVNCGAFTEGLVESALFGHERGAFTGAERRRAGVFESADGGTVFLDEVAELPARAQVALLRVLENGRVTRVGSSEELAVDARIVAATHRDLEALCAEQRFRWDLYYRLQTVEIVLPPLCERPEEIEPLAEVFLGRARAAGETAVGCIDPAARACLLRYRWPGNVRELRNAIDRAAALAVGDAIGVEDLPERVRGAAAAREPEPPAAAAPPSWPLSRLVLEYETSLILAALKATGWHKGRAAEHLGMPRRTLHHKLSTYGLDERSRADERTLAAAAGGAPPAAAGAATFKEAVARFESAVLGNVFESLQGNLRAIADRLQVSRETLLVKLRRAGVIEPG